MYSSNTLTTTRVSTPSAHDPQQSLQQSHLSAIEHAGSGLGKALLSANKKRSFCETEGPNPLASTTTIKSVDEHLNALLAVFRTLSNLHKSNVYHGNPDPNHVMFQHVDRPSSGKRTLKAKLFQSEATEALNEDKTKARNDVKIALSEFGGQLLLAAEQTEYRKINILKTHIESQVTFADQDDVEQMVSATAMHRHLRALKTLLKLAKQDYPVFPSTAWGPLDENDVIDAAQQAQRVHGRPPLPPH